VTVLSGGIIARNYTATMGVPPRSLMQEAKTTFAVLFMALLAKDRSRMMFPLVAALQLAAMEVSKCCQRRGIGSMAEVN